MHADPVQTPISLDMGRLVYKHVHLFCLTFSANVGHYMALIEAYRSLDRVIRVLRNVLYPRGFGNQSFSLENGNARADGMWL